MNEQVLKMISTLHARLNDVEAAVRALPSDQPQFAQQLDKVDDKVYLIQCEIEKLVPAEAAAEQSAQPAEGSAAAGTAQADAPAAAEQGEDSAAASAGGKEASPAASSAESGDDVDDVETVGSSKKADGEEDEKPFISDEMKDNLKDAGRALGGILKESKGVVSELSGTVNDLKSVFKFK